MPCGDCTHWVTCEKRVYADRSEVIDFQSVSGKGRCAKLGIETPEEFGCTSHFFSSTASMDQVQITLRPGAPWQHWKMGPCPDCAAKGNSGDGACNRCAGTGNVRHYEDGHIGEERTRLHPKEKELPEIAKPKCFGCSREVDAAWIACPYCGHRLEVPAETEVVASDLGVAS